MSLKEVQSRLESIAEKLEIVVQIDFTVKAIHHSRKSRYRACVDIENNEINVTSSLIDELSDDELAVVMGHEIGHILSPNKQITYEIRNALYRYPGFALGTRIFFPSIYGSIRELFHLEELYCDAMGIKIARKAGFKPVNIASIFSKFYLAAPLYLRWLYNKDSLYYPWYRKRIAMSSGLS